MDGAFILFDAIKRKPESLLFIDFYSCIVAANLKFIINYSPFWTVILEISKQHTNCSNSVSYEMDLLELQLNTHAIFHFKADHFA